MKKVKLSLVSLWPQGYRTVSHEGEFYGFSAVESDGGTLYEQDVPLDLAVKLIGATPWLFYPYYEGINADRHFRNTPRVELDRLAVMELIDDPVAYADRLVLGVVMIPLGPSGARGPEPGEEFGTGQPIQVPDIPPEEQVGRKEEQISKEEDSAAPRKPISVPEIPPTVKEVEELAYAKKVLILTMRGGVDIEEIPDKIGTLNSMIMDLGRKQGIKYEVADTAEAAPHPTGDTEQEAPKEVKPKE